MCPSRTFRTRQNGCAISSHGTHGQTCTHAFESYRLQCCTHYNTVPLHSVHRGSSKTAIPSEHKLEFDSCNQGQNRLPILNVLSDPLLSRIHNLLVHDVCLSIFATSAVSHKLKFTIRLCRTKASNVEWSPLHTTVFEICRRSLHTF